MLSVALLFRLTGLTWGLPASDAWDNDGIAPRDFLPGLIETFTPGDYFTYPPLHLALLGLLTLPVTLVVLARAPALAPAAVIAEALKVPYMTSFSVIARVVGIAMSLGVVYAIGKMAEELAGRRAGVCAAAVCGVNVVLCYYGQTSNLDVPYLFWGTFALLELTRAVARRDPRFLRRFALLAALSMATKDQAYALFLGAPLVVVLWLLSCARERLPIGPLLKNALGAVVLAAAVLLLVDGALFNPVGFRARLRFLAGAASQPHAYYSADALGRLLAATDSLTHFDAYYPLAFAPLVAIGLWGAFRFSKRVPRLAAAVPLAAIVSFTLAFNCVARRTEHRFLLPQMVLWATYAGLGIDHVVFVLEEGIVRAAARVAVVAALVWALFRCADVDANLAFDPRYDAEAWLRAHVAAGDTIEVHGKSVYLPRLPESARVVRVGPDPPSTRNPLFGAEERQDALGNIGARAPLWIVVSHVYAQQFVDDRTSHEPSRGRIQSEMQLATNSDVDQSSFFHGLFEGRLGYRPAHLSRWTSRFWPRLEMHGSLSPEVTVFERSP